VLEASSKLFKRWEASLNFVEGYYNQIKFRDAESKNLVGALRDGSGST
jgi:hypothetical protein